MRPGGVANRPSQAVAGRPQLAEDGVGSLDEGRRCVAEEARRRDGTFLVDQPLSRPAVQRVAAQPDPARTPEQAAGPKGQVA